MLCLLDALLARIAGGIAYCLLDSFAGDALARWAIAAIAADVAIVMFLIRIAIERGSRKGRWVLADTIMDVVSFWW